MTAEDLSLIAADSWMPSRIPARDALTTFVPDSSKPDPAIDGMISRSGDSVWYPCHRANENRPLWGNGFISVLVLQSSGFGCEL